MELWVGGRITLTIFQELPMAIINTTVALTDVITQVQELLSSFAQSEGFESDIRLAFGETVLSSAIADLASKLTSGEAELPPIEVRSPLDLNESLGAFVAETNQIFLSAALFEQETSDQAVAVLLEEIGKGEDGRRLIHGTFGHDY